MGTGGPIPRGRHVVLDVREAIRQRRSVRSFTGEPVSREDLLTILESAIWAPSGSNIQPWVFVVVTDPRTIRDIKAFAPGIFSPPPALVVACADLARAGRGGRLAAEVLAICDISMACQNMMLTACSLGLGSCVVRSFNATAVSTLLGLPPSVRPELLVTIGHPARVPPAPRRRPLEEVVHWERFTAAEGGEG